MYKNKFKQKEIYVEIARYQSHLGYRRESSEFLNRLRPVDYVSDFEVADFSWTVLF